MRTYGRIYDDAGEPQGWRIVETSVDGRNDLVYATALCQVLALNLNESPFWADYGIPAKASVIQQVAPDFYAVRTQQQFAPHFANLIIVKDQAAREPTYKVNITTHQGVKLDASVPIPQ